MVTSTVVWWQAWFSDASQLRSFCVAGVALCDIHLGLCCGQPVTPLMTCRSSLCVAGVAQPHIHLRFAWHLSHMERPPFAWQAWHLWHWVACLGRLGRPVTPWGAAPLCVAGVALGDIHLRFAWQAWHNLTSTVVLRGRRGTYGTGWRPWAGIWSPVTPGVPRHFAWQAWHLVTSTFVVAGVAQTHIYRRFAWQAWHLWYWVAPLGRDLSPVTPWGAAALCVAGVALGHIHLRFAWQAWHKLTSTVVLRGRRGTYGTGWRAWWRLGSPCDALGRRGLLRGRRGTW